MLCPPPGTIAKKGTQTTSGGRRGVGCFLDGRRDGPHPTSCEVSRGGEGRGKAVGVSLECCLHGFSLVPLLILLLPLGAHLDVLAVLHGVTDGDGRHVVRGALRLRVRSVARVHRASWSRAL